MTSKTRVGPYADPQERRCGRHADQTAVRPGVWCTRSPGAASAATASPIELSSVSPAGAVAAVVFADLDAGMSLSEIVVDLGIEPEAVYRLFKVWRRLKQAELVSSDLPVVLDGLFMAVHGLSGVLERARRENESRQDQVEAKLDILVQQVAALAFQVRDLAHPGEDRRPVVAQPVWTCSCGRRNAFATRLECTSCGRRSRWGWRLDEEPR